MERPPLAEELRGVAAFADLSDEQLDWLVRHFEVVELAAGEASFREGDPAEYMFVLLAGEMAARRETPPKDDRVFRAVPGQVSGMLPFSRMTHFGLTGRAVVPTRLVRLRASLFPEMLRAIPVLESRLVGLLTDRVRETTRGDQQREKLAALGKLSAGLAHELNNPAAAVRRSASELRDRLADLRTRVLGVVERGAEPAEMRAVIALRDEIARRTHAPLDPLAQSDRESEIADWLEQHAVERAYLLAPTFVSAGVTVADLAALAGHLAPGSLPPALTWFEGSVAADGLLDEVLAATRRISDLVAAIKLYTHMDSGHGQSETDVHRDLDSTLTILTHKIRAKQATVERRYAADLPRICAYASELTQVWTNLLDNALDAIAPGGHVEVVTAREGDRVRVEIGDDGAGIPAELQSRIWEPFFTTKAVGEGTGLGLDIAHSIVTRQHGGEIALTSRPGATRFVVRLPIDRGKVS